MSWPSKGQRLSYELGDGLTEDGMLGRTCLVLSVSSQGMVVGWRRARGRPVRDDLCRCNVIDSWALLLATDCLSSEWGACIGRYVGECELFGSVKLW